MLLQIIAIQENKIKMTGALCFPMASAAVSHSARLLPELRLRSQREHNYNCPISVRYMVRCLICGASDCMMTQSKQLENLENFFRVPDKSNLLVNLGLTNMHTFKFIIGL